MMNNSKNNIDARETLDLILDIIKDLKSYTNNKTKDLSIQKKLTTLGKQIRLKEEKFKWITKGSTNKAQWTMTDQTKTSQGVGFEAFYALPILNRVYLCEFIRKRAEVGIEKSNFLKILLKFMKDQNEKTKDMDDVLTMISSAAFPVKDGLFHRPTGWNQSCKTLAFSASTACSSLIDNHLKNLNVFLTNYSGSDQHRINLAKKDEESYEALKTVIESNVIKK